MTFFHKNRWKKNFFFFKCIPHNFAKHKLISECKNYKPWKSLIGNVSPSPSLSPILRMAAPAPYFHIHFMIFQIPTTPNLPPSLTSKRKRGVSESWQVHLIVCKKDFWVRFLVHSEKLMVCYIFICHKAFEILEKIYQSLKICSRKN